MSASAPLPPPAREYLAGALRVHVHSSRAQLGARAARDVVAHIAELQAARAGAVRVIFAAAPSQGETLAGLVAAAAAAAAAPGGGGGGGAGGGGAAAAIDWTRVEAFHMDEYIALPPEAPQRFSSFLRRHLWDAVKPGAVHAIDCATGADAASLAAECARYAALLAAAPIDVVVLGIGENGHLAFNDPPVADFSDAHAVKSVELELACRAQQVNDGCFAAVALVPTHALTLTMPALTAGRRLFCVVPGPTKRRAVTDMLTGPVSTACPASALRAHADCTLYVDDDSFDAAAVLPALLPAALRWTAPALRLLPPPSPLEARLRCRIGIDAASGVIVAIEPVVEGEGEGKGEGAGVAAGAGEGEGVCAGEELMVAPGLVDLQVKGFGGVDFNALAAFASSPPAAAAAAAGGRGPLASAAGLLARHGVTSFLPTLITAAPEATEAALAELARECAADARAAAAAPGVHLEGPFLSRLEGFRGAHEAALMRDPDLALFARWQAAAGGRVRAVTLAPELPGSAEFIRAVAAQGVLVAVGHSAADGAQLAAAAAAGARLATHVGNGAPALLPRHPNPIWEQLAADGLCASLIADGHHLPDSVLRVALRAKRGFGGCVLVSDSVAVAGLAPGAHSAAVGGSVVLTESGRLHLASDPRLLAGSAISLERAVAHVAFTPGLLPGPWRAALAEAWAMASTRPAALARLPQAAGLRVGAPADLVLFVAAAGGGAGGAGGAGGGGGDGAAPRGLRIQEKIKGGAVVFTALASS